jgi:hypothetical protein
MNGYCEDFPCCGHEAGDCNGQKYGSDESIKAGVHEAWRTGHGMCDHADGLYECENQEDEDDDDTSDSTTDLIRADRNRMWARQSADDY